MEVSNSISKATPEPWQGSTNEERVPVATIMIAILPMMLFDLHKHAYQGP